jgi:hypothetical protein
MFDFMTPEGRVRGRIDERSGRISVDTPRGHFSGRFDKNRGRIVVDTPEGRVRVSGSKRGGSLDVDAPGTRVRISANDRRLRGNVLAHGPVLPPRYTPPPPLPPPPRKVARPRPPPGYAGKPVPYGKGGNLPYAAEHQVAFLDDPSLPSYQGLIR